MRDCYLGQNNKRMQNPQFILTKGGIYLRVFCSFSVRRSSEPDGYAPKRQNPASRGLCLTRVSG
jgi:hypothetical protein